MSLRVVEPGLQTLIVDGGRPHSRGLGVPLGGAADRLSLAIGNALVGNPPDAAALEVCLAGPTLEAGGPVEIVVAGAPFTLFRNEVPYQPAAQARGGCEPLLARRAGTLFLRSGYRLRIGGTTHGARAYVCVRGGLPGSLVLGSRSSFEPVKRGDEWSIAPSIESPSRALILPIPDDRPIRAILGPQADWFDVSQFFGPTFEVTTASNRMGLRLRGEPLRREPREMVSEPVAPGTVQVVNDGQCIVLGVDGQTIGGYPKVAQVLAADLDRLGQLRPGELVTFAVVSLDAAAAAWAERTRFLHEWRTRIAVSS